MTDLTDEQKDMCNIDYWLKRKKEKNDKPELRIQKEICKYLNDNYPNVYYTSDALGLHTSWGIKQILLQVNSKHKHIDIIITKKSVYGNYSVLFLEVKSKTPFNKDGSIRASGEDQLLKQAKQMEALRLEGYKAEFVWTVDAAINIIHDYLGLPATYEGSIMDGTPYCQ